MADEEVELPECPICLNPLPSMPIAYLLNAQGSRACRHVMHHSCAKELQNSGRYGCQCPLCRAPFAHVRDFPSVRDDPEGWFDTVDCDGNGSLAKQEIMDALAAMLSLDPTAMEAFVDQHWHKWDLTGDGVISKEEFLVEGGGMLASVLLVLGQLSCEERAEPNVHEGDGLGWFYHYAGPKGYMTKKDFVRGVLRSSDLRATDDIAALKYIIVEFWFPACEDGKLTEKVFLQEDGVHAILKANLPQKDTRPKLEFAFARENGNLRVVHGAAISNIQVGGIVDNLARAQNPPSQGDHWELVFESEGGAYELCFVGGSNPHHGVCTIRIDGEHIGDIDQYDRYTVFPTRHTLRWEGARPGRHRMSGAMAKKNDRSLNFWLCLDKIVFRPIMLDGTEAPPDAPGQPDLSRHVSPALSQISCAFACGNEEGAGWEVETDNGWIPFRIDGVSLTGEIGEPIPFRIAGWEYIAILESETSGSQTNLQTMVSRRLRKAGN